LIRRFKRLRGIDEPLPTERIRVARAAYFGLCEHLDRQVGKILHTLDETGLSARTLVIYCTDHGEMAGEHGCWWKSNYYEGSVGIPLIARLPGTISEGTKNSTICNLMDLGPTLVEMAMEAGDSETQPMPEVDGQSLWRVLKGEQDPRRSEETFSEYLGGIEHVPSRMIRRGPWKVLKYHDSTPPAMYNLGRDPGEMEDLGQDPRYESVRAELLKRLYDGWDPDKVLLESASLERDLRVISRWGRAVRPEHEDTLPVPDVEKVELI
jgi:choline-sulfatase